MTEATATARSSRAPFVIGGVLVVALVVVAVLAGNGSSSNGGPPLSPTSTSSSGTKALVLLLREFGGNVRVGQRVPEDQQAVALLLHDGLDDASRSRLTAWVDAGGTLVVADPDSPLASGSFSGTSGQLVRGDCDIAGIDDVEQLDTDGGALFDVRESEHSCFGDRHDAFVVSRRIGSGTIVSIGSPTPFTNSLLDNFDNSVLAVRLLLPAEGQSVAILDPNPPGAGDTSLLDLVSDRVFQATIQLVIAFVVYALWRSRRVGRPIAEPQQVPIAGSQFVRAVGGLQQRTHATDRAAAALRFDTRRTLGERFGVPPDTDPRTLARLVSTRTGLDDDTVAWALGDSPVLDEQTLTTLGQHLDRIRQEAFDGSSR